MDNLLEIDLNEFVSKQIAEKIGFLKEELINTRNKISEQYQEISALKKQVDDSKMALGLFEYLRNEFLRIKQSEKDEGGCFNSKQLNQFLFIEKVLLNIFNIKKEANGWYCSRNYGGLVAHLAVNFYSNKNIVVNLLKILMPNCSKEISFIESYKMPFDYTKEEVIEFVKNPKFNTNCCIFGITQYWMEYGAGKTNMPYDLIMKNPHILEDDVFDLVLNSIEKKVSNYNYLFALSIYNTNISTKQLIKMGELLINLETEILNYKEVQSFISENLKKFSIKTLDFLYNKIQYDNQFKTLHWEKFPNEFQMKFLKIKSLDEILKILTAHSCTWTIEQKEHFLKEFTNH